jgi:hypothetical protein
MVAQCRLKAHHGRGTDVDSGMYLGIKKNLNKLQHNRYISGMQTSTFAGGSPHPPRERHFGVDEQEIRQELAVFGYNVNYTGTTSRRPRDVYGHNIVVDPVYMV